MANGKLSVCCWLSLSFTVMAIHPLHFLFQTFSFFPSSACSYSFSSIFLCLVLLINFLLSSFVLIGPQLCSLFQTLFSCFLLLFIRRFFCVFLLFFLYVRSGQVPSHQILAQLIRTNWPKAPPSSSKLSSSTDPLTSATGSASAATSSVSPSQNTDTAADSKGSPPVSQHAAAEEMTSGATAATDSESHQGKNVEEPSDRNHQPPAAAAADLSDSY